MKMQISWGKIFDGIASNKLRRTRKTWRIIWIERAVGENNQTCGGSLKNKDSFVVEWRCHEILRYLYIPILFGLHMFQESNISKHAFRCIVYFKPNKTISESKSWQRKSHFGVKYLRIWRKIPNADKTLDKHKDIGQLIKG